MTQTKVGVDSSKAWLDAWVAPDRRCRCANSPQGIAELASFVETHAGKDALVVLEASGGPVRISVCGRA
ncbi:hypothetical protein TPR58_20940 [Sphingomonas sp. HF-S3]|uniref:IS110 family transposase n=1 Tax=Sphingomonas rustica TaxID=3103142 RepID=A0ABV0BEZ5_9SPHN